MLGGIGLFGVMDEYERPYQSLYNKLGEKKEKVEEKAPVEDERPEESSPCRTWG